MLPLLATRLPHSTVLPVRHSTPWGVFTSTVQTVRQCYVHPTIKHHVTCDSNTCTRIWWSVQAYLLLLCVRAEAAMLSQRQSFWNAKGGVAYKF